MSDDIGKYLLLDEERNAADFLVQSLVFLSQVEQNRFQLKWFIISFHAALHTFMLLTLQKVNTLQIFKPQKTAKYPPKDVSDKKLLDFMSAYKMLKNAKCMNGKPFVNDKKHDVSMLELNNKLRNQFIHFKPMVWASEPWYPARVCEPLVDILEFCVKSRTHDIGKLSVQTALTYLFDIRILLNHYSNN